MLADKKIDQKTRARVIKALKENGWRNVKKRQENNWETTGNDGVGEASGIAAVGLVIFWILDEASRLVFPPRNLIPAP